MRAASNTSRGWQAEKISAKCQSCHAISVFDPGKISQSCQFCGSTALVPYERCGKRFAPSRCCRCTRQSRRARDLIRRWYGRQWLARTAFCRQGTHGYGQGIYLPYWTFDAEVHARWTAESALTTTWREQQADPPRAVVTGGGELSHVFDDDWCGASQGVHAALLEGRMNRFRRVASCRTTPVTSPDGPFERTQIDSWRQPARSGADGRGGPPDGANDVPGDTHRNLVRRSTYTDQDVQTHLVPGVAAVLLYYRGKSFQVVVNGVTGAVSERAAVELGEDRAARLLALTILVILQSLEGRSGGRVVGCESEALAQQRPAPSGRHRTVPARRRVSWYQDTPRLACSNARSASRRARAGRCQRRVPRSSQARRPLAVLDHRCRCVMVEHRHATRNACRPTPSQGRFGAPQFEQSRSCTWARRSAPVRGHRLDRSSSRAGSRRRDQRPCPRGTADNEARAALHVLDRFQRSCSAGTRVNDASWFRPAAAASPDYARNS